MADVKTSQILAKMKKNNKGAFQKSKTKPPEPKKAGLPGGLVGAIGKVSSLKIGETDDRKVPYFRIGFTVVSPPELSGKLAGISYYIEESEFKTLQQVNDDLCNDVGLMGADPSECSDIDKIPDAVETLIKDEAHFTFDTKDWNMNGRSGVKIHVQGPCDAEGGEISGDDDTSGDDTSGDDDNASDDGNGSTDDTSADDAGDADDANWMPEVGDIFSYKPNPKAKSEEVEVKKIDAKKRTCSVYRARDKKTFDKVPVDSLTSAE